MSPAEIIQSQELVVSIFRKLRPELLEAFGNVPFTRKGDASPVTEWDVMVETTLSAALAEAFPDLGFEGEETGAKGSREAYWLVDPIDGTSSFIRGLHYSTNMAALIIDGVAVAAVIYDFIHDTVYTAIRGKGALKDGKHIHVNTTRAENDAVLYSFSRKKFNLIREALNELRMRTLLTMGAAGHSFVMLAEGKIDGIVCIGTTIGVYDLAPGMLIAEEAGARVLPFDNASGIYRKELIIGTPKVVDAIERSGLL